MSGSDKATDYFKETDGYFLNHISLMLLSISHYFINFNVFVYMIKSPVTFPLNYTVFLTFETALGSPERNRCSLQLRLI